MPAGPGRREPSRRIVPPMLAVGPCRSCSVRLHATLGSGRAGRGRATGRRRYSSRPLKARVNTVSSGSSSTSASAHAEFFCASGQRRSSRANPRPSQRASTVWRAILRNVFLREAGFTFQRARLGGKAGGELAKTSQASPKHRSDRGQGCRLAKSTAPPRQPRWLWD
jgi:hypothetical protein